MPEPQAIATDFLGLVIAGRIDEAFDRYVDPAGRHHNLFTPSGMKALRAGMIANEAEYPGKQFQIEQIVASSDMVAVYSHLTLKAPGRDPIDLATMHLFKLKGNRIIEFWDLAQPLPAETINTDGPF